MPLPFAIAGAAITAVACGLLAAGHVIEPTVPVYAAWYDRPVVLLVDTAPVGATETLAALDWWAAKGYFVAGAALVTEPPPGVVEGTIVIDGGWLEDNTLGQTRMWWENMPPHSPNRMTFVYIEIVSGLTTETRFAVLVHELGHAFGFAHVETRLPFGIILRPTGHVMNPYVTKTGEKTAGIPVTE